MERIRHDKIDAQEIYVNNALIFTKIYHWDTQTDCTCGSIVLARTNTVSKLFTEREKRGDVCMIILGQQELCLSHPTPLGAYSLSHMPVQSILSLLLGQSSAAKQGRGGVWHSLSWAAVTAPNTHEKGGTAK